MFNSRKISVLGGDKFRDERSLAFDGSNDYVTMGDVLNLGTGDFTISIWAKCASWGGVQRYLISKFEDTDNRWYIRVKDDDPPRLQLYTKIGGSESGKNTFYGDNTVGPSFDDLNGQWVHICISSDRDGQNMGYINSVLNDSDSGSTATMDTDGNLEIGRYSTNEFVGNISEVAIYNKALSTSEVKTIYNGREPYNHNEGVASSNLQAWWRMGDGRLDSFGYNGIVGDETDIAIGSELITNGTMEADSNWGNQSSPSTNERSTTQVHSGTYSRKFTPSSSNDGIKSDTFTSAVASYKISFWVYPDDSTKVSWKFVEHDGTAHSGSTTGLTQDAWNYVEFYAKSASAGSSAYIAIMGGDETSGDWYVDDVSVKKLGGYPGIMTNMTADDFEGDSHGL